MRFIHASDIHLDSPLRSLTFENPAQIDRVRRATRAAFENLIDLCLEREVAFLILAGDLYDHDSPNMQIATFLRNQLVRLDKKGIRVIIKKGNHDADSKITSGLNLPANTRILSDRKPETVSWADLPKPVSIHGQSFKPGPITENLSRNYPAPVQGHLNIGVLHTSLAGDVEHDAYAPCSLAELRTKGYDYWALGHVHKGAILSEDPWIIYPGNLQGRNAKETGPKGCVLAEIDDDKIVSVAPIALDVVRWQHIDVALDGAKAEPELVERAKAKIAAAYNAADGRPTALRVTFTGETPLHDHIESLPNRVRQTVLEICGELGDDDIWIEKIKNGCRPPITAPIVAGHDAASELLALMQEVAGNAEVVGPLLKKEIDALIAKLPEELKFLSALKVLAPDGTATDTLMRLRPRLLARLAGTGDEK